MRFHGDTLEVAKNGLKMISEMGLPVRLGELAVLYLVDVWHSAHGSYLESLQI